VTETIRQAISNRFKQFFDTVALPLLCIFCGGGHVVRNGTAERTASLREGGSVHYILGIVIHRVKCMECRKSWRLLPPGLIPYKHYQLTVVADGLGKYLFDEKATLESVAAECTCSRSTVGRWGGWLAGIARPADIQARIVEVSGQPVVAPVRKAVVKSRDSARWEILDRAAAVVSLMEALGQAAGLEPPGVVAVLGRLLKDGRRRSTYVAPLIPDFGNCGLVSGWCSMEA
jgi:hypothetical protein